MSVTNLTARQDVANRPRKGLASDLMTAALFLAVALLPFQNSALSELGLGGFGLALSAVPIAAVAVLGALRAAAQPASVSLQPWALVVIAYVGVITLFGLWHFDWSYRDTPLLKKAAFAAIQWTFLAVGVGVGLACGRHVMRSAVRVAIVMNVLGFLLQPDRAVAGNAEHAVGFSTEPSHFGVVTVGIGLLGAYLAASNSERYVIVLVTLLLAVLSGSKGAMLCIALTAVIVMTYRGHSSGLRRVLLSVAVGVMAAALIVTALMKISLDLQHFTSSATRASGAITAIAVASEYPFGVGLGGFYPAFAETVPGSWRIIASALGMSVNLQEVFAFAYTDDRNLSSKTFLLDTLIYFGWPGLIAVLVFLVRTTVRWLKADIEGAGWMAAALVFSVLAAGTYYTVMPFYVVPILVGFALRELSRI